MTFTGGHAPPQGAEVRAGSSFDVPVRFDTDHIDIDLSCLQCRAHSDHSAEGNPAIDRNPRRLAAHLTGDATTTCRAWRVTRRDGVSWVLPITMVN